MALIVIDRSVGPVRLGMPASDVTKTLDGPTETTSFAADGRYRHLTFRYMGGRLRVTLFRGRVVAIATTASLARTRTGIGPGSPLRAAASLSGFRFDACSEGYSNAWRRGQGARTMFSPDARRERVAEVTVFASRHLTC